VQFGLVVGFGAFEDLPADRVGWVGVE
jgi:hypothetical protein